MTKDSLTEQLTEQIRTAIDDMKGAVEIKPAIIAQNVIATLDPNSQSPILVQWGCNLECRQIARQELRKKFEPTDPENPQADFFEGLQERYPVKRNGQPAYVLIAECTNEELLENAASMGKKITALQKHHDALIAYVMHRTPPANDPVFDQPANG